MCEIESTLKCTPMSNVLFCLIRERVLRFASHLICFMSIIDMVVLLLDYVIVIAIILNDQIGIFPAKRNYFK